MPVYVDPLIPTRPSQSWPFAFSCHMIADSPMELHEMARKIGLKREWYQCDSTLPHYDLTATKRKKAIDLGAILCSKREIARIIRTARRKTAEESLYGDFNGSEAILPVQADFPF